MNINERMTKADIISHCAEMFDQTISRKENTRNIVTAMVVGVILGLMA